MGAKKIDIMKRIKKTEQKTDINEKTIDAVFDLLKDTNDQLKKDIGNNKEALDYIKEGVKENKKQLNEIHSAIKLLFKETSKQGQIMNKMKASLGIK